MSVFQIVHVLHHLCAYFKNKDVYWKISDFCLLYFSSPEERDDAPHPDPLPDVRGALHRRAPAPPEVPPRREQRGTEAAAQLRLGNVSPAAERTRFAPSICCLVNRGVSVVSFPATAASFAARSAGTRTLCVLTNTWRACTTTSTLVPFSTLTSTECVLVMLRLTFTVLSCSYRARGGGPSSRQQSSTWDWEAWGD